MNLTGIFNSTLSTGQFITAMTNNFTGSDFITLTILTVILLTIAFVFRMPEVLIVVALLPIMIIFSFISPDYWALLGIVITIVGMGLFAMFKR
jgi:hypothetical protein